MASDPTYADAGVDLDAAARTVEQMTDAVHATHGPHVLSRMGSFGGLFDLAAVRHLDHPVLVASTDGVGTKSVLAAEYGRLDTLGVDLVHHCINDILVQGAEPLFFLDYVASGVLNPEDVARVVASMAGACRNNGCALLGGETAEMPGVYTEGSIDLVGTVVGVVDRARIVQGSDVAPGDVVLGLESDSPHTNGYSFIRHLLDNQDLDAFDPELGAHPIDLLLKPHRCYLDDLRALWDAGILVRGMAHITGGGLLDNPPRTLPPGTALQLDRSSWSVPRCFSWLQERHGVTDAEMHRVFNMGLGMLVVVRAEDAHAARDAMGDVATIVGRVVAHEGDPKVLFTPPL